MGEKEDCSSVGHQDTNSCQREVIRRRVMKSSNEDKEEVKVNEVSGLGHGEFKLVV